MLPHSGAPAYDGGMPLKLVPPAEPSPKQAVIERIKKFYRPDGMIQCPRCGSRLSFTTVSGAYVLNGRKTGGTVIDKDMCAECWKRGIKSWMLPELRRID
jgi:hypothetical protein